VRFKKGEEIYHAGDRAEAIFNIISGVVKSYLGSSGALPRYRTWMFLAG